MPTSGPAQPLELPRVDEVDRALDLREADREEIPGLYRLNAVKVPGFRVGAMQVLIAFAALHNLLLDRGLPWREFLLVAAVIEAYAFTSLVVLRRYFATVRRVHLGTVFVATDVLIFTLAIYATGADHSWLWPVYLVRVGDQLWIGRKRAAAMGMLSVASYGGLLLGTAVLGGWPLDVPSALFKVGLLAACSGYMVAAAGLPWNLQRRTHEARELILRLEEQALEIERQRARAEHASLVKSQFLARMSHELRTPLNSVVGFANVLLKKKGDELAARERDYLVRIRENGMHLIALINDVLDIARIEEGTMEIRSVPLDLEELVRNTVHQLEGRLVGSRVRLSIAVPEGLTPLVADEARLRQVLINLVGNAIKFTSEGSIRVEVRADPTDRAPLELRVTDTGIGIDSDRLATIFDAFEQVEGGYARKFGGTGLGLAISRSLCRLMGFALSVESIPGAGSTFTVWFRPDRSGGPDRAPRP